MRLGPTAWKFHNVLPYARCGPSPILEWGVCVCVDRKHLWLSHFNMPCMEKVPGISREGYKGLLPTILANHHLWNSTELAGFEGLAQLKAASDVQLGLLHSLGISIPRLAIYPENSGHARKSDA